MVLVRPLLFLLFLALVTGSSLDVTMFQRSSTYVMSVEHGVSAVFGGSFKSFYEIHMGSKNICWNRIIPRRRTTTRCRRSHQCVVPKLPPEAHSSTCGCRHR